MRERVTMTGTAADRAAEKLPVTFDADRQKILFERLESVYAVCGVGEREDLVAILSTLLRWNTSKDAWNTVRRWVRENGESL